MRRREFFSALGGAVAWPLAARAQQGERIARIGYLSLLPAAKATGYEAFRAELRELGYIDGKNLRIEYRSTEGDESRLPELAAELVGLNVDVIVTYATGVPAAQRATTIIPIVMASYANVDIVANIARPGGNITGSTFFLPELMAKRLELLKEVVPPMTRTGVLLLRRDDNASNRKVIEAMDATARALQVELQPVEVRGPREFESAFSAWEKQQAGGLVMFDHAQFLANAETISALAAAHRLPSIGPVELAAGGGLMAYGVDFAELFHRAAALAVKIVKGTKPGDIPIEQATKFRLVVKLKTAKALGLTVPPALSARAEEVIE